jgi:hypothetical protein
VEKINACLSNVKTALCGTTMDDCLFICTRNDKWIEEQKRRLKDAFEEVTVELGDELGLVGMQISMNKKQVVITQPKHVKRIIKTFQVTKGAPTPALEQLMGDELDSPLLENQSDYMSKCAMLMFILQ